jgi:hypothetical protein
MLTPIQLVAAVMLMWCGTTVAVAVVASWMEGRVVDVLVDEGMGVEFWCVSAGGGAAVGGLVALSHALEHGVSPVAWPTMAFMLSASLLTVSLVGVGKAFLVR